MKAAVLTAPHQVTVVQDWPEPECGPGDVLIAVTGVGVCGSDLSVYEGHKQVPALPWLLGHEAFGRIVEVGRDVVDRFVGQLVSVEPNYVCGTCAACADGDTSMCENKIVLGMNAPGVLAERIAVPAAFAWPVADGTPIEDVACVEPFTVARTAVRRSDVRAGDRVLVIGAGAQGLFVTASLVALGAVPYITEPHRDRLALAVELGARPLDDDAAPFPFVFDTSGVPAALEAHVHRAARKAQIMLIGLNDRPVPLTSEQIVRRQLRVTGSIIYDHPRDFAASTGDISAATVPGLGRTVRASFPLERAAEAFAAVREVPGKTWIQVAPDPTGPAG